MTNPVVFYVQTPIVSHLAVIRALIDVLYTGSLHSRERMPSRHHNGVSQVTDLVSRNDEEDPFLRYKPLRGLGFRQFRSGQVLQRVFGVCPVSCGILSIVLEQ